MSSSGNGIPVPDVSDQDLEEVVEGFIEWVAERVIEKICELMESSGGD